MNFREESILKMEVSPFLFFFKDFIYLFLDRGDWREEREQEKHQCVVASCMPCTGNLACNPRRFPDRELNQQPFGLQVSAFFTPGFWEKI